MDCSSFVNPCQYICPGRRECRIMGRRPRNLMLTNPPFTILRLLDCVWTVWGSRIDHPLALPLDCIYAFAPSSQDLQDSPPPSDPPPSHHLAHSPVQTALPSHSEHLQRGGDPIQRQSLEFPLNPLTRSPRITLSSPQLPETVSLLVSHSSTPRFFPSPLTSIWGCLCQLSG